MDPNQINFDEMMNNPDILLKACNDVFGNDTVVTQQQYYQQPAQTTSTYQQYGVPTGSKVQLQCDTIII